jgi:serine/threonine protein kinase
LGEGGSSKVYLAIDEKNNREVAIKTIPKSYLQLMSKSMELVKT